MKFNINQVLGFEIKTSRCCIFWSTIEAAKEIKELVQFLFKIANRFFSCSYYIYIYLHTTLLRNHREGFWLRFCDKSWFHFSKTQNSWNRSQANENEGNRMRDLISTELKTRKLITRMRCWKLIKYNLLPIIYHSCQ